MFYAKNVAGGANTVRATFGSAINSFGIVYIHEYSGIDRSARSTSRPPRSARAAAMNSGSATTTNPRGLIFGAGASANDVTAAGSGFTTRRTDFGNRTEDKVVTSHRLLQRDRHAERARLGDAHGRLQGRRRAPARTRRRRACRSPRPRTAPASTTSCR